LSPPTSATRSGLPETAISNSNEMLNASAFTCGYANSRLQPDNQVYSYRVIHVKSKRTSAVRQFGRAQMAEGAQ
jgi:hypothetical protein